MVWIDDYIKLFYMDVFTIPCPYAEAVLVSSGLRNGSQAFIIDMWRQEYASNYHGL